MKSIMNVKALLVGAVGAALLGPAVSWAEARDDNETATTSVVAKSNR